MSSIGECWEDLDDAWGPAGTAGPTEPTLPAPELEPEPSAQHSSEKVEAEIMKYQRKYEKIMKEQDVLRSSIQQRQELTCQFQRHKVKLRQSLQEDQEHYRQRLEAEKEKVKLLQQEEAQLSEQIEGVQATLEEEESHFRHLQEKLEVFSSAPDVRVHFGGQTVPVSDAPVFGMDSQIIWPMAGGTALITFEEEDVAKNILKLKEHQVKLAEECCIVVRAEPVHLLVPGAMEVDMEVCPRRILVSNLPRMDEELLCNKLEIHFSKKKNDGGEVDCCEMRRDIWSVVITFLEENVAERLTQTEYQEVSFSGTKHTVKVSPFVNGELARLEPEYWPCPRTVLLTGIPNVMEQEALQDQLEIYFQKEGNGGGDIEELLYNPLGSEIDAVFQGTLM